MNWKRSLLSIAALALLTSPAFAQTSNGKVTTVAPTYTNNTANALSLDTAGNLRVIAAAGGGGAITGCSTGGGTSMCQAEDQPATTGDIGIAALGVVTDGSTPLAASGDYSWQGVDAAGNARIVGSVADNAPATGDPIPVGGVYNLAPPTYTSGDRTQLQTMSGGEIRAFVNGLNVTAADGDINAITKMGITGSTTIARNIGTAPYVFNGTTWDRTRGDTNGAFAQGNVASGAADAGNPVKIGGVFNTTLPTLTNGQRGDIQQTARGLGIVSITGVDQSGTDGFGNTLTTYFGAGTSPGTNPRLLITGGSLFNGTSWDREFTCNQTAVINVTAGATTQLVALSGSTVIRVCSFVTSISAAGTATFVYGTGANCGTGTTAITGAMAIPANDNISMSSGNGSIFRTAAANALCLTAATGNVTGFVTYAQF